jgi:hypothetical protein
MKLESSKQNFFRVFGLMVNRDENGLFTLPLDVRGGLVQRVQKNSFNTVLDNLPTNAGDVFDNLDFLGENLESGWKQEMTKDHLLGYFQSGILFFSK